MDRYAPIALPPQEPVTVFVCGDCSAIIVSPAVHDTSGCWPEHAHRTHTAKGVST